MTEAFPRIQFSFRSEPADAGSAQMLAEADRCQVQWRALSLVRAKPVEDKEKKGADRGIDGLITFIDNHTGQLHLSPGTAPHPGAVAIVLTRAPSPAELRERADSF